VATPVASPQLVDNLDRPYPQSVLERDEGAAYVLEVQVEESGEYAFALSFQVLETISGEPGADSMIVRIGEDQLLVPVTTGTVHEAVLHFTAASDASGFYEAFFDGWPVGARGGISLIEPEGDTARIELFFLREGELVRGTTEILFDAVRLGSTLESVQAE